MENGLFGPEGPELFCLQVVLYHSDAESVKLQPVANQKAVVVQFEQESKGFGQYIALGRLVAGCAVFWLLFLWENPTSRYRF